MNSVIILAAGKSKRFGSDIPKQFHYLNNEMTILEKTISVFSENNNIHEIIIVIPENWKSKLEKINKYKIVIGGSERSQSSLNGLLACSENCKNVLIHDAARPFVSNEIISNCIKNLKDYDAVLPILSINDSVIEYKKNKIYYLNRNDIKIIQTPQGFKYSKILKTYMDLSQKNHFSSTDDFSVFINNNKRVKSIIIKGDKLNFKITNKEDFELAKKIIL